MTNDGFIACFLVCFLLLIIVISIFPTKEFNNMSSTKDLAKLATDFSVNQSRVSFSKDSYKENDEIFPPCITGNEKDCGWPLDVDIYDKRGRLLLEKDKNDNRKRIYPNIETIPKSCGFGMLVFDPDTLRWECRCKAPQYFGGDFCDIPGPELTVTHNCRQVAQLKNIENYDLSTFNPFNDGVCVECTDPLTMIPVIGDSFPSCKNEDEDENVSSVIKQQDHCYYDALNPESGKGSPLNVFVENYGCSCDYENGYVEIFDPNNTIKSIACVKIGKNINHTEDGFHRTDIAFYCVQNDKNPIQVHSYSALEYPFTKIFDPNKYQELLVQQPAHAIVHENDWLNRNVKPTRVQKIRRLNYPEDTWPVVNKHHLVNKYKRKAEARNISTYDLCVGSGFETKHWYELTNKRWLSNAIWASPIVYGRYATDKIWNKKSTLNPLGVKHNWYYGITMKSKRGDIVRLDTRGYKQEKKYVNVFTRPPHHINEMMNPKRNIYVRAFYSNYNVEEIEKEAR